MAPGGTVCLRDYARYDLTEVRFAKKKRPRKLAEHFYVRGDGTRAYYFDRCTFSSLFCAHFATQD